MNNRESFGTAAYTFAAMTLLGFVQRFTDGYWPSLGDFVIQWLCVAGALIFSDSIRGRTTL